MQAGGASSRAFRSRAALPSEWDRRHYGRQQHVQDYLKVDGLTVKYVGPGESDAQAATIFSDKPVPMDVPLYYFEVTIVNKGDSGYIGIGFCTDSVNLGRLPGWEPHSYGYHGDDGHAFHGSGHGRPFGPGFTSGDVVGALLDRSRKTISYYKNGESVGVAFYDVQEQQLYPCVGMRTKHEEVRANFGGAPFCVDLHKLHAEFRERVLADIAAVELPVAVQVAVQATSRSSNAGTPAAAAEAAAGPDGSSSSNAQVEAAAAACTKAICALDSSSSISAALADLESAVQAYLAAMEAAAAAGDAASGAPAAAAGSSAVPPAVQPAAAPAGKASRPLMLYYVFNYLLHRRCWRTAAIVAREMVAVSSSSSGAAAAAAADAAGGAADAAGGDGGATAMECSTSVPPEDHPMPDAAAAAAAEQPPAAAAASSSAAGAAPGAFSEADVCDALQRQRIYAAVCEGDVAGALAAVRAQYGPHVLEQHPRLHFKLRVQQFVELVRQACSSPAQQQQQQQQQQQGGSQTSNGAAAGATAGGSSSFEAALAYGRAELGPGSKCEQDEELLSDALSLLAYSDPAASPCGHLLRESYRAELAEEVNGCLLKARGGSGAPLLETAYRQAVVLVEELKRIGLPAALVLDVPSICCGSSGSSSGGGGGGGSSSRA